MRTNIIIDAKLMAETPCKTIDAVLATCYIESKLTLLHSDRDFDPFVECLDLRVA